MFCSFVHSCFLQRCALTLGLLLHLWGSQAGDTLSRNTFRNGTVLRDIEAPDARGQYTSFCG